MLLNLLREENSIASCDLLFLMFIGNVESFVAWQNPNSQLFQLLLKEDYHVWKDVQ
jgi:hypothetical protein